MKKTRYPIRNEFFPFHLFAPPMSRRFVTLAQKHMKTPAFLWKDRALDVRRETITAADGQPIEAFVLSPTDAATPAPCVLFLHGGGFVFEGSNSHFRMAMAYAKGVGCKLVYVRYRLAPKYPFPTPQEDCYAALCHVYDHAARLGIDPCRIGVAGDSAGGTLAAVCCQMARDRQAAVKPLFQLLVYPWLDARNASESNRRFTDTPVWNSTLSKKVGPLIDPCKDALPQAYRSPVEAADHADLPPAYIETAEFDCLHDDGVLYAKLLRNAGVEVQLHETQGTMHGFDTVFGAPTSQRMIAQRIAFMRERVWG